MGLFKRARGDCTLETFARKNGIPESAFRNKNGKKTRKDKLIRTMRKDAEK